MYANRCQITLGTSSMEITREPVASNTPELIPKIAISLVTPIKINSKPGGIDAANWTYRFNSLIAVAVCRNDGENDFVFDVQEVTNQAGWTANLAGQQACVDDINTWLAT